MVGKRFPVQESIPFLIMARPIRKVCKAARSKMPEPLAELTQTCQCAAHANSETKALEFIYFACYGIAAQAAPFDTGQ